MHEIRVLQLHMVNISLILIPIMFGIQDILAAMIGAFFELPDAEVIYSGQLLFKGKKEHPFAVRFGSFNRSLLTNRNYIDINALCHTHDLYKRLGGFDETLIRLVDYDLIMRMAESAQMYSVPVLLSHYYYD